MKVYKGFFVVLSCFFALFFSATEGHSSTITASAGPGGSISPAGPVAVTDGDDQTFTITPDPAYGVFDIMVDSVSVGRALSYTFTNVTADHSITASFFDCDLFPVMLDWDESLYGTINAPLYSTIMEAYDFATIGSGVDDFTLMLRDGTFFEFLEDLIFDADASVILDGGYDCSFLDNSLLTRISGSLTIAAGTVIPSNILLSAPLPCDGSDPNNLPGNPEICDGLDNNCNGLVDDGLGTDADGDGHYTTDSCILTFTPNDDCDDSDPNNFPGNPETCDGLDNNCDGQIDEGLSAVDADNDGYSAEDSCGGSQDDCNDNDGSINPGATEILCDWVDQNCDGQDLCFTGESCVDCHAPESSWISIHDLTTPPDGTCATCHSEQVNNVLSGHYGKTVRSDGNNMTAGSTIVCESCHDPDAANHTGGIALGTGTNFVGSKISSAYPNITCDTCHENRAALHSSAHSVEVGPNDLSYDPPGILCSSCHVVADWSEIEGIEHNVPTNGADSCSTCHNSPRTEVQITISAGTPPIHCLDCHSDKDLTFHHGPDFSGTTDCETCHGHDSGYEYSPGLFSQGAGSFLSHSTHTEMDADDLKGPHIACSVCHDTTSYPFFNSGTDSNGDGFIDLAETDVCDNCHSPDGPFDGVDDATIGARLNWVAGVYTGSDLTVGKEKWCVSCHDAGTSLINGRQAPDVAGDNANYGYYVSGHGRTGAAEECDACHGLDMDHNFDGQKTYLGADLYDTFTQDPLRTYKLGFRLKDVDGMDPLLIPLPYTTGYVSDSYKLCYSCHDEETLMNDTRSHGCYNDQTNPYKNAAAITTQFRNMHKEGHDTDDNDMPANFHADHLIDAGLTGQLWYSNGPGSLTGRSANTCITCHNPHGDKRSDNSATLAMTVGAFEIVRGSDAYGDYGEVTNFSPYAEGSPEQRCLITCHTFGGNGTSETDTNTKWYYNSTIPNSIALADNISTDPARADSGFSNNLDVRVRPISISFTPLEIMCAEDNLFTINATPWETYPATDTNYIYTLLAGEGSRTAYCKTRNTTHSQLSAVQSASITIDMSNPAILATTLISPNGSEVLTQGTDVVITWTPGDITDVNLKALPISLDYSTDSGATFPNSIATEEANDGTYTWNLPIIDETGVRVRITVTDQAGNQSSDTSDGDFTIQAP